MQDFGIDKNLSERVEQLTPQQSNVSVDITLCFTESQNLFVLGFFFFFFFFFYEMALCLYIKTKKMC